MAKWFHNNAVLVLASAGLVGFVVSGAFSIHEWLTGDARYLTDVAFTFLWLGISLFYLWQWRQQQLRM
jgi:hypothetical protein